MKRIGLLGGMSWESSVEYERLINQGVRAALGGVASADLVIRSYDFAAIEALQGAGRWDDAAALLSADARMLEAAGAELVVLCTNTMHLVAPAIEAALTVPFLHIGDATAEAVLDAGVSTVALLGTRFTMERDFSRQRLEQHGIAVLVPEEPDRTIVHDVIYEELVRGVVSDASRRRYVEVVDRLVARGAGGVIAGCTEIELLLGQDDVPVPYFPTTRIHAEAAVRAALDVSDGPVVGYGTNMATKYKVNDDAVRKARQMIDSNQYDLETEWGDAAPSTEESNDKIDRDGYDGYGEWHLALDTEASEETKDRYAFPFGDFRRVIRSGLIAAKQRAAQNEHSDVERAADDLLEHLDASTSSGSAD